MHLIEFADSQQRTGGRLAMWQQELLGVGALCLCNRAIRPVLASLVIALLVGANGCTAYDPPAKGDRTSDKFKADLDKCRTVSTEAVRLKNAATPQSWVISPITGPPAVRAAILKCMEEKGYAQENATG
jgi:hypothetical protein